MKPAITAIAIVFLFCSHATAQQKLTLLQQQEDFKNF